MAPKFLRQDEDSDHHEAAAAPGVLDLSHLARYTVGNTELEHELLRLFRVQMRVQAAAVGQAEDADTWKFATHTLKGVARSIGAWRIGAAAERLETVAPDGQDDERRARLLATLEEEMMACEREIDRLLGEARDAAASTSNRSD